MRGKNDMMWIYVLLAMVSGLLASYEQAQVMATCAIAVAIWERRKA